MDLKLNPKTHATGEVFEDSVPADGAAYRISSRPVVDSGNTQPAAESRALPRSYGTETLCLMARDPRTLFAYWDIDWSAAFHEQPPRAQKIYLRVLNHGGSEPQIVEVEPMAGSCYVTVSEADAAYTGEIGFYHPPGIWNSLATSEVISTPPDAIAGAEHGDFATVPFHLTFQHMMDALRISKQENESLTAMLAELRQRATATETNSGLTAEQRELAKVMSEVQSSTAALGGRNGGSSGTAWTQQKLENILRFGTSSPAGGFGGSSHAM